MVLYPFGIPVNRHDRCTQDADFRQQDSSVLSGRSGGLLVHWATFLYFLIGMITCVSLRNGSKLMLRSEVVNIGK